MLPEGVHDVEQDWTVFMLNQTPENSCQVVITDSGDEEDVTEDLDGVKQQPLLHVLNLVFRKFDSTAKRCVFTLHAPYRLIGPRKWVVKALAICTHHPHIQIFKVRCPHSSLSWLTRAAARAPRGVAGVL